MASALRLALFQPDIPQNTGTILRLGACLGVAVDLIEPAGFVLDDKRLRRAAMDYFDHIDLTRHASWQHFLGGIGARRLVLLSSHARQAYDDFAFRPDDIMLLGRESGGVDELARQRADAAVRIPLRPGLRSLNVAVAAAMVLGEALRQTGGFP